MNDCRRTLRLAGLCLVVAVGLGAAGCGDDDKPGVDAGPGGDGPSNERPIDGPPGGETGGSDGPRPEAGASDAVDGSGGEVSPDGGGADTAGDSLPASELERLCGDYYAAICDKFQSCYPFVVRLAFGDLNACKQRSALACRQAESQPGSTVTAAMATACIQALGGATCDQLYYNDPPAACKFMGTRPAAAACVEDAQCQSGYCDRPSEQMCGVCSARVPAGSDCDDDDNCNPGLVCADSTCVAPAAIGTACSDTAPCRIGAFCNAGTCAAQKTQAGADCTAEEECASEQGLFCYPVTGKCTQIQVAQATQACGLVGTDFIFCVGGAQCNVPQGETQGQCSALVADGAACGPTASCRPPAECIAGTCQIPAPLMCN